MKRILYICLLPLLISVSSCEDFLNQQPIDELPAEKFWKTEADIKSGVAGMYDGLQGVVSSRYIAWGEGRSDNLTNGGTGVNEINYALNGLTANMGDMNWDGVYATILRANLAISNIPLIAGGDLAAQKTRNNYLAQAYAMRAYCHFLAMKVFGGVPVILEPVTDRNFRPSRTPAEAVLVQVIADLEKALTLVDRANTNVYELNIGAIYSILTDAFMWQKNYAKAVETTDKLKALNRYALAATPVEWNATFTNPNASKEAIWNIFWSYVEDGSNGLAGKIGSSTNTSPFEIDDNLVTRWQMQKKDFRRFLTYDTLQAPTLAVSDIYKHYPIDAPDPKVSGNLTSFGEQFLPPSGQATVQNALYRWADIILMRAEALNMIGGAAQKSEAVAILNQVKSRAGVRPLATVDLFASQKDLETAILNERQLEFFAEGKRWFDLRRTGRVIEVMDPLIRRRQQDRNLAVTGFGDPGLVLFPISSDALNENPNLTQNSPYSR